MGLVKARTEEKSWFLYIVETMDGLFYTGITTDLKRRFSEHQDTKKGAKFFRRSEPKKIHFSMKSLTRSEALRLEARIKKLPKAEKQMLTLPKARKLLKDLFKKKEKS